MINNLQLVKYMPIKPLYLYGICATLTSIIFSYLNMNHIHDYRSILSTYYNIQLHTNEIITPNNLELIKLLNHNIYKEKYEYKLRQINKIYNNLEFININNVVRDYQ